MNGYESKKFGTEPAAGAAVLILDSFFPWAPFFIHIDLAFLPMKVIVGLALLAVGIARGQQVNFGVRKKKSRETLICLFLLSRAIDVDLLIAKVGNIQV